VSGCPNTTAGGCRCPQHHPGLLEVARDPDALAVALEPLVERPALRVVPALRRDESCDGTMTCRCRQCRTQRAARRAEGEPRQPWDARPSRHAAVAPVVALVAVVLALLAIPAGAVAARPPCTGSPVTAQASITPAVNAAQPGDVVCLGTPDAANFYTYSAPQYIDVVGTPGHPIIVQPSPGATVTFTWTGPVTSGGLWQTNGTNAGCTPWCSATRWVTFDGLNLDGGNAIGNGYFLQPGSVHVTVENSRISNMGSSGIAARGSDYVTVYRNDFSHNGYVTSQGWGSAITLWTGGAGDTSEFGGGPGTSNDSDPTDTGFHNVVCANRISGSVDASAYHSDGNAIIFDGGGANYPASLVCNNLIYQNGGRGIEALWNDGDLYMVNNTLVQDGLDLAACGGACPELMANDAPGVHWTNDIARGHNGDGSYPATGAVDFNVTTGTFGTLPDANWAKDAYYKGALVGVSAGVTGDATKLRSVQPAFSTLATLAAGTSAYSAAPAPWTLSSTAFRLQPSSPLVDTCATPTTGMTGPEAASAAGWLAESLSGGPRTVGAGTDCGAHER
jgi:hypothetical protein